MLSLCFLLRSALIFLCYLSTAVRAEDQSVTNTPRRKGYSRGDVVPVSCLNRTIDSGEHITDDHGNLQYIPFLTCNETNKPLQFTYGVPTTQPCTIAALSDELYHLLEYFVHSDVPLSCRVPSYPLTTEDVFTTTSSSPDTPEDPSKWTPFTIALQGVLQRSHLHLHTNVNALFHTEDDDTPITTTSKQPKKKKSGQTSHLIASTAYSLPDPNPVTPAEGTKIIRAEPLTLTFNVGWIEGAVLPGMAGKPVAKITDHSVGFSFLSITALGAAFGLGALAMLVYERRKSGRSLGGMNGLLGGNVGNGVVAGGARGSAYTGYGGYGGYNGGGAGKRD